MRCCGGRCPRQGPAGSPIVSQSRGWREKPSTSTDVRMSAKASDDKALAAPIAAANDLRFGFGANWAEYVRTQFSDERVAISKAHLLRILKLPDLRGRTFLDIGCGSGLHSLAAWRAGADQ